MRRRDYTYTPRPEGGYRRPNLDGLFDETTPPPVIRRPREPDGAADRHQAEAVSTGTGRSS